MSKSAINSKQFWRWSRWTAIIIVLVFSVLILPTWMRKARLIRHIDEVGGFFYSYHSPEMKKLMGRQRYKIKAFLVPKVDPILGEQWPGIFKQITHVEIEARGVGGTEYDLDYVRNQNQLRWLDIGSLPVENAELDVFKTIPDLIKLQVNISNLDSEGIAKIAELRELRSLYLRGRELTEKDAVLLGTMLKLELISVVEPVPEEGQLPKPLLILKEKLPNLRVINGRYFSPHYEGRTRY